MIMHFERLIETCGIRGWGDGHQTLTLERTKFVEFIRDLLCGFPFDEQWYLEHYPDVKSAIELGSLASGWQHYVEFGYFEGRMPGLHAFDPLVYLQIHEDLATLLDRHDSEAAAINHFVKYGYREGRRTVASGRGRVPVRNPSGHPSGMD